ncbi:hypothetical protein ACHAXN_013427 [Cyclotella atomus]
MAEANQSQSMESIDLALNNKDEARQLSGTSTSQLDANLMGLHGVQPTFEPLKVCLDDDSSIEDGDEDMFDDDAFYFGDEDFQALLSRIPAKAPVSPRILTSSNMHNQNSFLPLHPSNVGSATEALVNAEHVHCIDSAASSTTGGLTSVGLSSSSASSLGNLTLLSQESALSHMSSNSLSKKPKSKRRVSLHNDVAVVPIPSRTDYPSLVKARIWSSATELYQNAARNSIEFASEGWNWRNVTEDEKMILSPSGERIHPIHLMHSRSQGHLNNVPQEHDDCKVQAKVEELVSMDTEVISS